MKKKQSLFADILGTVTKYFLILVLIVIVGIFFSSIRKVENGNVALVLRFAFEIWLPVWFYVAWNLRSL